MHTAKLILECEEVRTLLQQTMYRNAPCFCINYRKVLRRSPAIILKNVRSNMMIDAKEAKQRLIEGNQRYIDVNMPLGDISPAVRRSTAADGQHPYAIVITRAGCPPPLRGAR